MRVIVQENDGTEKFRYQADLERGECNLHPADEEIRPVLYALFIATMFLSRASIGRPLERPTPEADDIATLTPG